MLVVFGLTQRVNPFPRKRVAKVEWLKLVLIYPQLASQWQIQRLPRQPDSLRREK